MNIEDTLINYLNSVDDCIDKLSSRKEGELTGLPSWIHSNRDIFIGLTNDREGIVIKIAPNASLDADNVNISTVNSTKEINDILSPMQYSGPPLNALKDA